MLGRNHTPNAEGHDQAADRHKDRLIHSIFNLLILNGNARHQRRVDIMRVHNVFENALGVTGAFFTFFRAIYPAHRAG